MKRRLPWLLLAITAISCGEVRSKDQDLIRIPALSYVDDVAPLLERTCVTCHSATTMEGSYDLSNWRGVARRGSDDVPNAIPGDVQSKLIAVLGDETHASLLDTNDGDLLTRWVVEERMAYFSASADHVHPAGWMLPHDRGANNFHGGWLRASAWDMRQCQVCHGEDFAGRGNAGSCMTCHTEGPTGCSTCHGDGNKEAANPPSDLMGSFSSASVGLHAIHLNATLGQPVACRECHTLPSPAFYAPGHLFDDEQRQSDLRAELTFGNMARGKTLSPDVDLLPSYDAATHTCSNVYCHALDGANPDITWTWTAKIEGGLVCGSCHGNPPAKTLTNKAHPNEPICENCHIKGYKDGQLDPMTHINGKVEVF
ncbi:MAG: CxxxxCH/CxxCH domain-containing protein [Deltaproteobacteria bacterium]|nr:CxxxxCH/CxxCH domain-containing protein [Deltaproteobacteria bacterium]